MYVSVSTLTSFRENCSSNGKCSTEPLGADRCLSSSSASNFQSLAGDRVILFIYFCTYSQLTVGILEGIVDEIWLEEITCSISKEMEP